uniref:GRIP domain-containing protein n=1 Tax=Catagonus wagneri TaxID=51154 RepID=A0A8C3WRJ8_9CETA
MLVVCFEADVCKLKEEKEKRIDTCRERELENQALQETNTRLCMMLRERESEKVKVKEKALALEHLLRQGEQGTPGQLSQILNALASTQEKTVCTQMERNEAMLLLRQKQMENCALQSQVQHFHEKELCLKKELERLSKHALQAEETYKLTALVSEERAAKLERKVTTLQEQLLLSTRAMEKASHHASLQIKKARALANMKMVLAEWMEEADHLEGKLVSAHTLQEKAHAALDVKEDQIKDLKKQTEVQQEVLDDVQKKMMTLISNAEGKVDKSLMRNLFMGSFQTPKQQRREVLQIIGSTLGIKREAMEMLLNEEQGGGPSWMTRWLGSKSVPNTPLKPKQQAVMPKNSFSDLFVQYLETDSHHAFPPTPKPSAPDMKSSDAPGRKIPAQNGRPLLQTMLGSTPKKPEVKAGSLSVSLVKPLGPEAGGSGHLLLNAAADVLPTYTPLLLSPGKNAGAGLKELSKQRPVL